MDTFRVIKTKHVSLKQAMKQLSAFAQEERENIEQSNEVTNKGRARIADDVLSQIEVTCASLEQEINRNTTTS